MLIQFFKTKTGRKLDKTQKNNRTTVLFNRNVKKYYIIF